ncbi:replication-relaxation family protein [Paenibacillus phoenicis]|uniref:Replication-relaxation family protein n=1 Tax=Paenibacillus phoenicis TaxID=554117 RepID=A0ABU5PL47_9BACL|nr:replication-relaxation family protein [Paenibacillus phoenicis]MEA3570658.1 replication-relaxation family protein [Paenibacillus phoenicis]
MYEAAKKELLALVYRYGPMTAKQAAIVLNYRLPTLYAMASQLNRQGLIRSIPLPFLRLNHVGYGLTAQGAKTAALLAGEEDGFRSKAWEKLPMQLEHVYGTNAFFVSLIEHSLHHKGEGITEWQSTREAAEQYAHFKESGKKTMLLRPDGLCTYVLPGRGRLVLHVEYDTGSENQWKLQDKLWLYGRVLSSAWRSVAAVHVMFVTKIESRPKRLLRLWAALGEGPLLGRPLPNVWAISESEWKRKGVEEALWWGVGESRIRLKEMPLLPPAEADLPLLGKQPREPSPIAGR